MPKRIIRIMPRPIKVVAKEGEENAPLEIMEQSIIELAAAFKVFNNSRIKTDVILTYLARRSGVARASVETIFAYLSDLETLFLKPK